MSIQEYDGGKNIDFNLSRKSQFYFYYEKQAIVFELIIYLICTT